MAAAVADFRPGRPAGRKLAKDGPTPTVAELEPTADVLAGLAARRRRGPDAGRLRRRARRRSASRERARS